MRHSTAGAEQAYPGAPPPGQCDLQCENEMCRRYLVCSIWCGVGEVGGAGGEGILDEEGEVDGCGILTMMGF